jgi:hypothetical protein
MVYEGRCEVIQSLLLLMPGLIDDPARMLQLEVTVMPSTVLDNEITVNHHSRGLVRYKGETMI